METTRTLTGAGSIAAFAFVAAMLAGGAQAETFAYVGNAGSNDISVFRLTDTGLVPVETEAFVDVEKAGSSTPLAVSPDKKVLFAGVRSQPFKVESFAIDPKTGALSHIANAPLADSMANIATDRTGKVLFSASYGGAKVAVNPIASDGKVGAPAQVVPTGPNAHSIQPTPDNRFALATNLGSDDLLLFRIDPKTGELSPGDPAVTKMAEKSGPRHFVFHPNGKIVYLLGELDASVTVLAFDPATGAVKVIERVSALPADFTGKPWAADLHLTPDGRFLYASERTSSTLAGFRVDPETGRLTRISTVPTEKQPRGFAIDPTGRFLAAAGELSNGVQLYLVDQATGRLDPIARQEAGRQPNWIEFVKLD